MKRLMAIDVNMLKQASAAQTKADISTSLLKYPHYFLKHPYNYSKQASQPVVSLSELSNLPTCCHLGHTPHIRNNKHRVH